MGGKKKITKTEYTTLASLRFALRQFMSFSEEAAQAVGLTPQQHQALLAIKGYPDRDYVTVGELAERLLIVHHSAVGLINRLVALKLVVRQTSPLDKRQVHIYLTPEGEKILEDLSATHREQLKRIGPELSRLLGTLH